jgi:hypothetical protein
VEANDAASICMMGYTITSEVQVFNRIIQRLWNITLGPQNLVPAMHIVTWVCFMMRGGI